MSANVSSPIDMPQLVDKICDQIKLRAGQSTARLSQFGTERYASKVPMELAERLRSINGELEALNSQIQAGEPQPSAVTLRGRIGFLFKRRLLRFLWWHDYQIRNLMGLIGSWTREESKAIHALLQEAQGSREIHEALSECQRQVHESNNRLQQLESAQLRLQAAEIERNVRKNVQQEADYAAVRQELNEIREALKRTETRLTETVGEGGTFEGRVGELAQRLVTDTAAPLSQKADAASEQLRQLAGRLAELGIFTHQTRASLSIQDRRLAFFIEEARRCLPEPKAHEQLRTILEDEARHRYDSLYAAFEDVFRGSREEIKARQAVYLPLLREHGIGSPAMPLLDLGCGRGEWLELLGEHGFQASGVDRNAAMIECSDSKALPIVQGDALGYLRGLPDACLGAVTSFHMVEHLPFDVVLTLVDESLRVLKSGGILILETPNPANLLVGAHTFHLDPTHLKPLPSPMLRFFVEGRGFCDVHVRELHPYPEVVRLQDDGSGVARRLNDCLYGPQDYAVIGRKP